MSTPEHGLRFWVMFAFGGAAIVFGVMGLVGDAGVRGTANIAVWLAGSNVINDLLLAPLACLVGIVLARVLPEPCRAPIRAALLATAVVLLIAFPALRGYGRDQVPDNSSVDPLNYATATTTVIATVWAAAATWTVTRLVARRTASLPRSNPTRKRR